MDFFPPADFVQTPYHGITLASDITRLNRVFDDFDLDSTEFAYFGQICGKPVWAVRDDILREDCQYIIDDSDNNDYTGLGVYKDGNGIVVL